MNIKQRIQETMNVYGLYYNLDEVVGHMTRFNPNNLIHIEKLDDDHLLMSIENACGIIDLNNDVDED